MEKYRIVLDVEDLILEDVKNGVRTFVSFFNQSNGTTMPFMY